MPLDDKRKGLFSDLGRPTRRGVRKCPKCGTVNGTRGNSCKNKSCDVVFRDNGNKKKQTTDACRIILNNSTAEIFSVRLRERGPDYRSFVQLTAAQPISSSSTVADIDTIISFGSYPRCFVNACNRNRIFPCCHIKAAQKCFTTSQRVLINHSVLGNLSIPQECKQVLSIFVNELPDLLVQRCSKASFVVKCNTSSRHPLGYLHILFFKPNKEDGTSEPKFLCTCRPFKIPVKESDLRAETQGYEPSSKLCMHYYACIAAFASNDELALEFEFYLARLTSHSFPGSGMLGQLHLVTLPAASDRDDDVMEPSHMSVDIMRENLSLLESIAAGDDSTLPHVQGLEGVLSDQIIVTSVDDTLTFGDSSALDGLDETDSQVAGHLTHISDMLSHPSQNQQVVIFSNQQNLQLPTSFTSISATNITERETILSKVIHVEKQAESIMETDCSLALQTSSVNASNRESQSQSSNSAEQTARVSFNTGDNSMRKSCSSLIATSDLTSNASKPEKATSGFKINNSLSSSIITRDTFLHNGNESSAKEIEKRVLLSTFDRWLASVNERINATMNYILPGKPESLIYYICHEHFDILKERITCSGRKKRLPNHTLLIHQRDRAPVGRKLTKHVWKITNVVHVLQIFQNNIVPLKLNQFFVKTSSGEYHEWAPPKEEGDGNQPIIPVLHSTSLKIGKTDVTAKENVPFSIEWIPDVLPDTRYGELRLCFQFAHNGPIHTDEERRNSIPPVQKLLQCQEFST